MIKVICRVWADRPLSYQRFADLQGPAEMTPTQAVAYFRAVADDIERTIHPAQKKPVLRSEPGIYAPGTK